MGRGYSKKTVDTATLLLDVMAGGDCEDLYDAAEGLGVQKSSTGYRLAVEAMDDVANFISALPGFASEQEIATEAAELVRSGWMIDDDIEGVPLPVETEYLSSTGYRTNGPVLSFAGPTFSVPPSVWSPAPDEPTQPSPEGEPGDYGSDS